MNNTSWWIESEAVAVINELMDVIERQSPNYYYKSEEISRADNLLSYIEQHGVNQN